MAHLRQITRSTKQARVKEIIDGAEDTQDDPGGKAMKGFKIPEAVNKNPKHPARATMERCG